MTLQYSGWRKSSHSEPARDCVEAGRSSTGGIGVRDGKAGDGGPVLEFTRTEWAAFTRRLRERV